MSNEKALILLGIGGSRAYGLETETSDVDLRGCALNSAEEILSGDMFETITHKETKTDIVIYSFKKLVSLLTNANPNTLELLGFRDYLYISPVGQELLDNKKLFLSQKAYYSFGGYARSQLARIGKNRRLAKEMCHLVRLYLMGIDLLEKGEVIVYRKNDLDLLRAIRAGDYINDFQPKPEFFEMADNLEARLKEAKRNTKLPEKPDYEKIKSFVISVHERVVKGEIPAVVDPKESGNPPSFPVDGE